MWKEEQVSSIAETWRRRALRAYQYHEERVPNEDSVTCRLGYTPLNAGESSVAEP